MCESFNASRLRTLILAGTSATNQRTLPSITLPTSFTSEAVAILLSQRFCFRSPLV